MSKERNSSGRGQRDLRVRVKTAKGRKLSSTLWLDRQLNDPYVQKALKDGYRGRAAYKILELDDKFRFLVPGARVVDLGCAPGGWCQVATKRVNALGTRKSKLVGTILGVDLQEVDPIPGCDLHVLDFMEDDADIKVREWLGGQADVVMSDMAPNMSGNAAVDIPRAMYLAELAVDFADQALKPGGDLLMKVFQGEGFDQLIRDLRQKYTKVVTRKPKASRPRSREVYLLARGKK